jgi:hypothetical protein
MAGLIVRAMKTSRRAFLGGAGYFALIAGSSGADSNRRVSVAEIESIRLELEQVSMECELQIRIRDPGASAHRRESVTCDLYYVYDPERDARIAAVTLKRISPPSEVYTAAWPTEHWFTHGTVAKVEYTPKGWRLPISTWYTLYFH